MQEPEKPPVQTQFLIFTLFGEYVQERGGTIWTSDLLHLMEVLGVSERAVRSTLSRLTSKGWLISRKEGRQSEYSLTRQGHSLLVKGRRRIFEPSIAGWDGRWHLVLYSLPEEMRDARHALRTQLMWQGFGSLTPGAWISAHNRADEIRDFVDDMDIADYVEQFYGPHFGMASDQELVQRCWPLDELAAHYQVLIDRYESEYLECLAQESDADTPDPDPELCFLRRYWLTHEFQAMPLRDPNLPAALLPPDWIGFNGRELFHNYRQLLGKYANQFVDEVMGQQIAASNYQY
jgi:phenylacetic acid degradation operon negative regulatory protein